MSGDVDLRAMADAAYDEASFVAFVQALAADSCDVEDQRSAGLANRWGPDQNGWENGAIGTFLDAASAWALASQNGLPLPGYTVPTNPWTRCAQILLMGKHYE